jgi:hypothetical protein
VLDAGAGGVLAAGAADADAADADITAVEPGTIAKAAAGVLAFAELQTGLAGSQAWLASHGPFGRVHGTALALLLLGVACVVPAMHVYRARWPGALGALVVGALTALLTGSWLLAALLHGLISCVGLVAPLFATAATLLTGLALPALRRAAAPARVGGPGRRRAAERTDAVVARVRAAGARVRASLGASLGARRRAWCPPSLRCTRRT